MEKDVGYNSFHLLKRSQMYEESLLNNSQTGIWYNGNREIYVEMLF